MYKTCLICTHSFSGSSYFEFLLSTFVLASLFMSSFFSPFLLLLLYHFPHLTVLTVAVSRASLSIPRPPSFATPHTPLAARLRAPKLTTLAYDRSAPQLPLSKLTSKAVRDSRHIASSGCWHSCGVWGLVLNLVVPLPPTKLDTVYDRRTVWHQSQIQRRCKTGGCERRHRQRTFSGTCVVKVRL